MLDELLERIGLKYEDLNAIEKETLHTWLDTLKRKQLTLESIRKYIASMRDSVEQELTQTTHNSKQDLFLKARLRNYMLIEAFLTTPERAKEAIEQQLSGIKSTLT